MKVTNIINNFSFNHAEESIKLGKEITPAVLDKWVKEVHKETKENDFNIGKAKIRELMVCYILSEFGTEAFGVKPLVESTSREVSETSIRKMKNQRKKGFVDIKLVKAAK